MKRCDDWRSDWHASCIGYWPPCSLALVVASGAVHGTRACPDFACLQCNDGS